jgi:hypothetical protein
VVVWINARVLDAAGVSFQSDRLANSDNARWAK